MGADENLLDLQTEPQQQPNWCWAAVSTMAAHSLGIRVKRKPVSQLDIVRFERLEVKTEERRQQKSKGINDSICTTDPAECDLPGEVWLYRLNGTTVPETRVLKKAHIIREIVERERPVILKWDYSLVTASSRDLPGAEHYVIITGYNPDTDKFRVFDPWSGKNSSKGGSEHWISYQGYLKPKIKLGQKVFAIHSFDMFNLREGEGRSREAALGSRTLDPEPKQTSGQVTLDPVDFGDLGLVKEQINNLLANRVVYTRDRIRVSEPLRAGEVYPIVVITTKQLMQRRDRPESWLEPKTSSVIASVVTRSDGRIVDSLLLYNDKGKWQEAEYSNTTIAGLLDSVRGRHLADIEATGQPYYLVSIPEQSTFFAARGFGSSALLVPFDNDARGDHVEAHEALGKVVRKIEDIVRRREKAAGPSRCGPQTSHRKK